VAFRDSRVASTASNSNCMTAYIYRCDY